MALALALASVSVSNWVHRISFALWILLFRVARAIFPLALKQSSKSNTSATPQKSKFFVLLRKMFVKLPAPRSHLAVSVSICHNAYNFKSRPQEGPRVYVHMQMRMRSVMLNTCHANADDNANEIIFTTFFPNPACFLPIHAWSFPAPSSCNINYHLPDVVALWLLILCLGVSHTHVMCQDMALMSVPRVDSGTTNARGTP